MFGTVVPKVRFEADACETALFVQPLQSGHLGLYMVTLSRLVPYVSRSKSRISLIVAQNRDSNPLPVVSTMGCIHVSLEFAAVWLRSHPQCLKHDSTGSEMWVPGEMMLH
eukprot:SAG31_NODE_685_length_12832_cov_28.355376_14_plen_110_part_00